ncbi:RNA polymerase sigma factor [Paraflavitalea speifideaquila]|uniref:RNA polymerase sigma factor n=1 Tax=Paraflavitalea speifideaquila TaxID=3076558 RepID=UPI0028F061AF|nr:sigma-70 family RNA polymerase sigma factor [Paraflavitalea speifideiaquila]
MKDNGQLIPHLFRTEYRKIVSVLCRHFGFEQIEMAEDLASDTFLTATQTWGVQGIPANPVAWLYNVARNKARNQLQRHAVFDKKIGPEIRSAGTGMTEQDIDLSQQNINDSQLQMMFAICHPVIPTEAQIGLSLRILCGFGIEEIADAFLSNKETINKRLFRAREKLREEKIPIALPPATAIDDRLSTVLKTIYLLFNEGYYSLGQNHTLRKELCFEAMRLCTMLVEHPGTNKPAVNALLALMCFHASRFEARTNAAGELILYDEQDTDRWNTDLVSKGGYFLRCAAQGNTLSRYHLEAGIAYWNTQKQDSADKLNSIMQLYNQLLQIEYSPIAALNRTYALSKVKGKPAAIAEAEKLQLTRHHFYYILLGELYSHINNETARQHFGQAFLLARTDAERQAIQKKLDGL